MPVRTSGGDTPLVAPEFVHQPDLLDEAVWRQTDDFWQYAMFAAIAYIRVAADRAGVPVRQVCQELPQRG